MSQVEKDIDGSGVVKSVAERKEESSISRTNDQHSSLDMSADVRNPVGSQPVALFPIVEDVTNSSQTGDSSGLTERVCTIERSLNIHAYLFKGLVVIGDESDSDCLRRFLTEVLKIDVNDSTIATLQHFGRDPRTKITTLRVGFPTLVHEKIKKLVIGGSCMLIDYNKKHGTHYYVEKSLTVEEQQTKKDALLAQFALRSMLGKDTWVSLSPNNYKLRIGEKGQKWFTVDELKRTYPKLESTMELKRNDKPSLAVKRKAKRPSTSGIGPASKVSRH